MHRSPARNHESSYPHSRGYKTHSYKTRNGHKLRSIAEYPELDHHTKRYRTARLRDTRMTRYWSHIGRRSLQLESTIPTVSSPLREVIYAGQNRETPSPRPLTWVWSYHKNRFEPDDPLLTPSRGSFRVHKLDVNGDVKMTDWNCSFPGWG